MVFCLEQFRLKLPWVLIYRKKVNGSKVNIKPYTFHSAQNKIFGWFLFLLFK